MKPSHFRQSFAGVVAFAIAAIPLATPAQTLEQVLKGESDRTVLAQESQENIDAVVKETRSLEDQYKGVLKEIEGLEIYNTLLQRQVDNQVAEMGDINTSIDQVEVINRQIVPLMINMIDSLDQFIVLDVPFLQDDRTNRVAGLREMMERQDVTVAEKFRRVMEAYQIENEFGRTIETYKGTLEIDGAVREVDFLRVGRIALLYQTADAGVTGAWDQPSRGWVTLDGSYKNQVKLGLQIAKKQVAPDLVLLPVDAPEGA